MTSAHPWLKFYPRDWRGDQALRAVSIAARGLWIEMLCVMHEASPYGHLILGGRAVSNDVLARIGGLGVDECGALLSELESAGVLSRTRKGVIYSRRMVKDHSRSEIGRKSVNKRYSQTAEKQSEKAAPSRSPSRTATTQKPEDRRNLSVSARGRAKPKVPLPDDWKPEPFGEGTQSRKIELSWKSDERARQIEAFRAHHLKNDGRFSDWQQAWSTWVLNSPGFARTSRTAEPANYFEFVEGRA
jgi:hypothetical protein